MDILSIASETQGFPIELLKFLVLAIQLWDQVQVSYTTTKGCCIFLLIKLFIIFIQIAARFATFGIKLSSGGFHTVNGVTIGSGKFIFIPLCSPIQNTIHLTSYFELSVGNGILIESNDNTIINNFIIDSDLDGVIFDGTDRNMIKGNTIIDSRRAVRNDNNSNTGTSDDNHIISNTIISSGKDGMLVVGERNVIQGNTIDQSGDQGIVVGSSGGRTPPISEGVIIKDNSITNSNEYGITINDGTTNTVVIGNTIAGYTNGSIDNNGDGTAEADNIEVM